MFSDGTVVPAGSSIWVNSYGSHHDEALYPSPETFDGFRYVAENGSDQSPMSKPMLEYNAFGYGKHAWCVTLFLFLVLAADIF